MFTFVNSFLFIHNLTTQYPFHIFPKYQLHLSINLRVDFRILTGNFDSLRRVDSSSFTFMYGFKAHRLFNLFFYIGIVVLLLSHQKCNGYKVTYSSNTHRIRSPTTLVLRQRMLNRNNDPNDDISSQPSSLFNFVGSSAKILVSGSAGVLVVVTESSWRPLYFILGGVVNAILSKVIKNILKMPRPKASKKGGYGMPSSHAQALFYFASVIGGVCLQDRQSSVDISSKIIVLLSGLYAFVASAWRVKTGLHTLSQTLVGGLLGLGFGQLLCRFEANITGALHYTRVPLSLRLSVVGLGGFVLYYRELKKLRKKSG